MRKTWAHTSGTGSSDARNATCRARPEQILISTKASSIKKKNLRSSKDDLWTKQYALKDSKRNKVTDLRSRVWTDIWKMSSGSNTWYLYSRSMRTKCMTIDQHVSMGFTRFDSLRHIFDSKNINLDVHN